MPHIYVVPVSLIISLETLQFILKLYIYTCVLSQNKKYIYTCVKERHPLHQALLILWEFSVYISSFCEPSRSFYKQHMNQSNECSSW